MINIDEKYINALTSPRRSFTATAILSDGTNEYIVKHTDSLVSFKIERSGESGKFFGFGIPHKVTLEIVDLNKEIVLAEYSSIILELGVDGLEEINFTPVFEINQEESKRDEVTNKLTIIGYDRLYDTNNLIVNDFEGLLEDISNFAETVEDVAYCVYEYIADGITIDGGSFGWNIAVKQNVNIEGTETIRELLDDIAELTQTIYYLDRYNTLVFKSVNKDVVGTIDKAQYMKLTSGAPAILTGLAFTTELGDNLLVGNDYGYVQEIKDNMFLTLMDDVTEILEQSLAQANGAILTPFECAWRGNFLYEIGDTFYITGKDGEPFVAHLYNDTLTYNGGLSQVTQLEAAGNFDGQTNATTLGEAIKETYARVDKTNKRIDLLVSDADAMSDTLALLQLDADSINATVQKLEETMIVNMDGVVEGMAQLASKVEASITAQDVSIAIKSELDNGVDKVITSTGYTLDNEGLKISKSNSELSTKITENGMEVKNGDTAVLTANDVGVDAANLHATTFLIIGNNSRLEDYGTNRTGCFWIGG